MNINAFIANEDEKEKIQKEKEENKILKKMPKSFMRLSWPNANFGELNINLQQILNAKNNLIVKTEEEIEEEKRKKEEKKRIKMEKKKKQNDNNNNNISLISDNSSSDEDSDEQLKNKIEKELNFNLNLNKNNNNKVEEEKDNLELLKHKKISPENMIILKRRLSQARNKFIEIYQKKEKLTLGEEIIKKAKELEEKINIPKELIEEVHQSLNNLKLPSRCIIDDETSKVIEDEINEKPVKIISKDEILKIMKI
jgi:hypothetical protein